MTSLKMRTFHETRYCFKIVRRFHSTAKPYVITTPIFYVNGEYYGMGAERLPLAVEKHLKMIVAPHLGHMYSAVIADASHRFHRMLGIGRTVFSTGTDEHGLKVQQAAGKAGQDVKYFCDVMSSKFQALFQMASVDYTRFIRTTDADHVDAVRHFWKSLMNNGNIYVGKYEGWYCTSEETFLTETQLKDVIGSDGKSHKVSMESGHPVEWIAESNYMFKLSKYRNDLLHWLRGDVVYPKKFAEVLVRYCSEEMDDLSVSRSRSRLQWGIQVPDDKTQTIYVWLDALVNYITVCGYPSKDFVWPPSVQVIGKDILKFHGIYWPALLMAVDLEPPHKLFCHSHWTVDNEKMSKSKGNIIDPVEKIATSSCDAVRYFLLAEGVPHSDGNYSSQKFTAMVNSELADTLGNLLNRCTSTSLNQTQTFPTYNKSCTKNSYSDSRDKLVDMVLSLPDNVKAHYQDMNFYKGIELIMACARQANRFMQESKPWEMKSEPHLEHLSSVIHITMETLRVCGILLTPITPNLSAQLLDRLGIPADHRDWSHIRPFVAHTGEGNNAYGGHKLGSNTAPLFARLKS